MMETVNVTISLGNGANRVTRDVPDYEVPVLENLHGPENINRNDSVTADSEPDALEAYEALQRRYSSKDGAEALANTYKNFRHFVGETGLPVKGSDEPAPKKAAKKAAK